MYANQEMFERGAIAGRWAAIAMSFSVLLMNGAAGQDAAATAAAVPDYVEKYESREFRSATGEVLPYRLLKPLDFDEDRGESSQRYPLIIFLHGAGQRGNDNVRQLDSGGEEMADEAFQRRHPAFVMVPQCPEDRPWISEILFARHNLPPGRLGDIKPLPLDYTLQAVDALRKEFPIDATRIYGIGLSMGCDGVYAVMHHEPKLLAAGVMFSGYPDYEPLQAIAGAPLWVFHGDDDGIVPVDGVRGMVNALREVGGKPNYTEYPGLGHGAWGPALENRLMWDWLFAQRRRYEVVGEPLPNRVAALSVGDLRGHREAMRQLALGVMASLVGALVIGVCVRHGR